MNPSTPTRERKERKDKEPKATLPVGHPKAGYVSPDLSEHFQTGTLPPEEIEWHEARNDARDEEVEEVESREDEVAKEEQKEREEANEREAKAFEQRQKARLNPTGVTTPKQQQGASS